MDKRFKQIGALWDNKGYLNGVLDWPGLGKIKISIIKNQFKKGTQPDYIISEKLADNEESKLPDLPDNDDDEVLTTFKGDSLPY